MSSASIFRSSLRAALALAFGVLALATPALAAPCPHTLFLESSNGKYYVAVFAAPAAIKSSIDITVYSKTASYTASLSQISIEKPWTRSDADRGFRSYAALLANPGDDPWLAAVVRPYDLADGTICPPEERFIPSIADVKTPPHPPAPEDAALESAIAAEAGDGSNAFPMTPAPVPRLLTCAVPFEKSKALKLVPPDLANAPPALETDVAVDLNPAGTLTKAAIVKSSGNPAFDQAVLAAAEKTTYAPAIFACIPQPGRYVFEARTNPKT